MSRSAEFQYPKTPDDPGYDRYARVHALYGANDINALFPEGVDLAPTPWPRAPRLKSGPPADRLPRLSQAVHGDTPLEEIDPRFLHSSQPMVTRQGVAHYLSEQFEQTGETFADQHLAGNAFPVVYDNEGINEISGGHHRATAALLRGQPLRGKRA